MGGSEELMVRFDGFRWNDSPRAEEAEDIWYELDPGYGESETRELLAERTQVYLIGSWWLEDRSNLAVDIQDPTDRRIFDFATEDLWDNSYEGRPIRGSLYPVFASYADLLGHVVEVELPDGTHLPAED